MKAAGWKKYDKMHARKRENYMIDADKIKQLTQKLRTQGDISLEEADEIYFLSLQKLPGLSQALIDWYSAVSDEIKKGRRGNFIFTIDLSKDANYLWLIKRDIQEYGTFEDLCKVIMIDKRLCPPIKGSPSKNYYEITTSRAGMLNYPIKTDAGACTIAKFLKKFNPVIVTPTSLTYKQLKVAFEIASGVSDIPDTWTSGEEVKLFILSFFIKFQNFPCIVAGDMHRSIVFVEERNAPVMKIASETPFEELIENALSNNIIDKITAWEIESYFGLENSSARKFVKTSAEYLDEKVRLKMAREYIQKIEGQEWMEEIR